MDISELKQALEQTWASEIRAVYFQAPEQINVEPGKDYPLILVNQNTIEVEQHPRNTGAQIEATYTLDVFVIGYFDEQDKDETRDRFKIWRDLNEQFIEYLAEQNENQTKLKIRTEVIGGEFYTAGIISIDYEAAIGYKITIDTYC